MNSSDAFFVYCAWFQAPRALRECSHGSHLFLVVGYMFAVIGLETHQRSGC